MKISLDLQYCYGIKSLQHEFDFTNGNAFLLYAPNGSMKTSLARVFNDISQNKQPIDVVFPFRDTHCSVKIAPKITVDENTIFVVDPYEESYRSGKIATLLVNKNLKDKYESVYELIDEQRANLLLSIGKTSGLKKNAEYELLSSFNIDPKDIYLLLEKFENDVNSNPEYDFSDIAYRIIFNQKVQDFLSSPDNIKLLKEYVQKYNELIEKSTYFKKGIFNHNNASTVSKNLNDNGFFKAKHSVTLMDKNSQKREVIDQNEFETIITGEKERIFKDKELIEKFEAIDKAITKNIELKNFRDYLEKNPHLIPELVELDKFKYKIWISYLIANKDKYNEFLITYHDSKKELDKIIKEAKKESTAWHNVIKIFNERFTVPFVLEIANQEDVILKEESPSLIFKYIDVKDESIIGEYDLFNILSIGERRAFYILNIIFDLEARAKLYNDTIVIFDDIADSFDYKNKYAIIEYLKDNLETGKFYFIILTHNFDFFRTVQSRLNIKRDCNCLMSLKTETDVKLVKAEYLHPFDHWKSNLHKDNRMLIAAIPMVRNLIEYMQGCDCEDYLKLTSLLHRKQDSDSITLNDLAIILNKILYLNLSFNDYSVIPLIFEEAEKCLGVPECINLENKVVLSIAIRLAAEKFMIEKINDPSFVNTISGNQTIQLFKKYKTQFESNTSEISVLDQVVIITPEPIHLNSFMYEPLIDISDSKLKDLYNKVKSIPNM